MNYAARVSGAFKKDYKRVIKRNYDISLLDNAMEILRVHGELPDKYYPHLLRGNYIGYYECHIKPDWLLIWEIDVEQKIITFHRTGTHSDLFKK